MRCFFIVVSGALSAGCLRHDLSPQGYACGADLECGDLVCVRGRCAEPEGTIRGLLRLNGPLGNQLLTFASEESDALLEGGFTSEGAVLSASTEPAVSQIPLYRLIRPGPQDYLLTPDISERDKAIAMYAFPFEGKVGLPVYRLYKPVYRFYAVGEAERDRLLQSGWTLDRALFRAEAP